MKSFLQEIAEWAAQQPELLAKKTFVFPNRRASLYFQHHLAQALKRPQWAPRLVSIEEFFKAASNLQEPDRLTLIFKLYEVYRKVLDSEEPFDKFYFWGDMLLRDFDEVDKYRVGASWLFKDLSKLKELDESFDYLTEEQRQFLTDFWIQFEERPSAYKETFLRLWRRLPEVYTKYGRALRTEGLGYEGMIHRAVADSLERKPPAPGQAANTVFAGFNALTRAEEVLLAAFVEQGAQVFWDFDQYYADNPQQEAGLFARQYKAHPILSKTFPSEWPDSFRSEKRVVVTGVAQRVGQAKLAGQRVREILAELPAENRDRALNRTVIVLPDESMLLPVLHSLPPELTSINVTMGFPLRATPLYTLLDLCIDLQVKRRNDSFFHRELVSILSHAYILTIAEKEAHERLEYIVQNNRVRVELAELPGNHEVFQLLFRAVEPAQAVEYMVALIEYLGTSFSDKQSFDREFAFHFHQHLSRLQLIFRESDRWPDWRGFQKLFRQVTQSVKIPFTGEPLRGLQIMGVLETRNLDFDHVILISMNEGMLPAAQRQGSYIPHTLRKAYGLPAHDHQDAMYAYLFYRLLQRAGAVDLLYSTEPDVIGNGEMSRYVQQLLLESGWSIQRKVLQHEIHVHQIEPIVINKDSGVVERLERYLEGGEGSLSPTSLNDFIECGLRFYLKHLAKITEADEVEEDVDARVFGNLLHDVIHWIYEGWDGKGEVTKVDLDRAAQEVDRLIERAFRTQYVIPDPEPVSFEGQRVVVREMVAEFVRKILALDAAYAPFRIESLEQPFEFTVPLADGRKVRVGGKIDRVDRKQRVVRVIDYKTGGDKTQFESIESLFSSDKKHNKAAFQTLLYALGFAKLGQSASQIRPGLMNRANLFDDEFVFGLKMGRELITDATPLLNEFEAGLESLVGRLLDLSQPFVQTTNEQSCQYCPYKNLCRR
jgi:hypothetical protein